jgi:hypothetical protein
MTNKEITKTTVIPNDFFANFGEEESAPVKKVEFGVKRQYVKKELEKEDISEPEDMYSKGYSELNADLNKYQKKYFLVNRSGTAYVCNEDKKTGMNFTNIKSFHEFHSQMNYKIDDKKVYLTRNFMESKFTKRYEGIVFDPSTKQSTEYWNLWNGFKVEGKKGSIKPFIRLLHALTKDDKESVRYHMNYLAHMVQKPHILPKTAIVLKGAQGIGKGTFMDTIRRFCPENYTHLGDTGLLTGDFNGHFMKSLIIFADEISWGGDKKAEGKLKYMITENERMINDKNKTAISVDNYVRLFFASNEDWVVPIAEGDRRYFVSQGDSRYKGQTEKGGFFDSYKIWLEEKGGLESIFNFLSNMDISNFNVFDYPHTEARLEMMITSLPPAKKFIYHLLNGDVLPSDETNVNTPEETRWIRNELYNDLVKWTKSQGKKYPPSIDEFGKAMNECFIFEQDTPKWRNNWKSKDKGYFYKIPKLNDAMERFAKNVCKSKANNLFFSYDK